MPIFNKDFLLSNNNCIFDGHVLEKHNACNDFICTCIAKQKIKLNFTSRHYNVTIEDTIIISQFKILIKNRHLRNDF